MPVAQIVPAANGTWYFDLSIIGNAIRPIVTTVAPTIPVLAAISMPTTVTEIPRPPGKLPNTLPIVLRSCSASLVFSNVTPIKTKSGTATRVWFEIIPKILLAGR